MLCYFLSYEEFEFFGLRLLFFGWLGFVFGVGWARFFSLVFFVVGIVEYVDFKILFELFKYYLRNLILDFELVIN